LDRRPTGRRKVVGSRLAEAPWYWSLSTDGDRLATSLGETGSFSGRDPVPGSVPPLSPEGARLESPGRSPGTSEERDKARIRTSIVEETVSTTPLPTPRYRRGPIRPLILGPDLIGSEVTLGYPKSLRASAGIQKGPSPGRSPAPGPFPFGRGEVRKPQKKAIARRTKCNPLRHQDLRHQV
jgi:hypothetical protein